MLLQGVFKFPTNSPDSLCLSSTVFAPVSEPAKASKRLPPGLRETGDLEPWRMRNSGGVLTPVRPLRCGNHLRAPQRTYRYWISPIRSWKRGSTFSLLPSLHCWAVHSLHFHLSLMKSWKHRCTEDLWFPFEMKVGMSIRMRPIRKRHVFKYVPNKHHSK